jgi:hypothetical protein
VWRIHGIGLPEVVLERASHDQARRVLGFDPL